VIGGVAVATELFMAGVPRRAGPVRFGPARFGPLVPTGYDATPSPAAVPYDGTTPHSEANYAVLTHFYIPKKKSSVTAKSSSTGTLLIG